MYYFSGKSPLYETLISFIGALLTNEMSFLSKPFQCDHFKAVIQDMHGNTFARVAKDLFFV